MKKQSRPAKNSIVQLERERNIILRNLGKLESQLKDVLEMIDNDKNDNKLSSSEKKEVYAKKEHLENLIEESIQKIKIIDIQIKEYEKDIKKIEDNYIESVGEKVDVARENMRILDYLGFTNLNQNKLNEVLAQVSV
jgi:organic radical activating enzyme